MKEAPPCRVPVVDNQKGSEYNHMRRHFDTDL